MKALTCLVAAAFIATAVLFATPSAAQEKPKPAKPADPPKKPTVMQRKLAHSQKLLEGLALEDYDKIRTSADGLIECVKDASWRINDTDKYVVFSNDFLRRVENLQKAAKAKNIDAAALAYVDMTLTCVKCHQFLRGVAIGQAPDLAPLKPLVITDK